MAMLLSSTPDFKVSLEPAPTALEFKPLQFDDLYVSGPLWDNCGSEIAPPIHWSPAFHRRMLKSWQLLGLHRLFRCR
ncbi:hypothetical protein VTL71DRAFT_9050 [Oculimacula yallundae]|uniref:Uncharacterized protein n=1 Tax=Oculimacula yallundae TaxID=86028 RepID=A0ABR4BW96_9HELO